MTVVAFPGRWMGRGGDGEAVPTSLVMVSAALCSLGEPALAAELASVLARTGLDALDTFTPEAVEALLIEYGPAGPARLNNAPVFRPVSVGAQEAWAFTPEFRTLLSVHGVSAPLRETFAV
ncbi:hypothetical protein [Phenylobacterium aquaticum]|uniref:hypothetical protein n=1 Tax=Phenylobacterium aquaticum TaxID=1763816 RepID=UPI0026F0BBAE|nr:hypothetical protein [Phenylobacterium aquaticum]